MLSVSFGTLQKAPARPRASALEAAERVLEAPQGRRTVSSNGCEGLLEALRGLRRVSSCLKAVSERHKTKCRRHCAAGGRFPAPRSRRTVSSSGCEGLGRGTAGGAARPKTVRNNVLEAPRGRRTVSSNGCEALRGLRRVSSCLKAVSERHKTRCRRHCAAGGRFSAPQSRGRFPAVAVRDSRRRRGAEKAFQAAKSRFREVKKQSAGGVARPEDGFQRFNCGAAGGIAMPKQHFKLLLAVCYEAGGRFPAMAVRDCWRHCGA